MSVSASFPSLEIAGENALIVYFAEQPSAAVSDRMQHTVQRLHTLLADQLIDTVPSYASLLVIFDPLRCDYLAVKRCLRQVLSEWPADDAASASELTTAGAGRRVELPVFYDPEAGPDLEALAKQANLSVDEVIQCHQQNDYRVYAIGFAPGFAYLGQVDERIAMPRLSTPRLKVPRGAVAIADRQTAVYPAESPGGWNLIGLCPVRLFDPAADPVMPVAVGDVVRFKAIDRATFLELGGQLP